MIKVYHYKGGEVILNESEIVSIERAGTSSQWHGIRSVITMSTGKVIESGSSVEDISKMLGLE